MSGTQPLVTRALVVDRSYSLPFNLYQAMLGPGTRTPRGHHSSTLGTHTVRVFFTELNNLQIFPTSQRRRSWIDFLSL